MRSFYILLLPIMIFFSGCGDFAPQDFEELPPVTEYILIQPTQPPFIDFGDQNIGEVDDFEFERDIELPTTQIPSIPELFRK